MGEKGLSNRTDSWVEVEGGGSNSTGIIRMKWLPKLCLFSLPAALADT